jgi:pantothenate kinase
MDVEKFANGIIERSGTKERYLVAVAGPPGAGKSTFANRVCIALKSLKQNAKIVPMDGFHLANDVLISRGLLNKKGAPETFDAEAFVNMISRLRTPRHVIDILTFDRRIDCVVKEGDSVRPEDRILIFEGNYLVLNQEPWSSLLAYWDETAFLNPGIEELERRLIRRWIDHGLEIEAAQRKVMINDIPNAKLVIEASFPTDHNL